MGTPGPGRISCSCFLLRHHNAATQLRCALPPPPRESWAAGLLPTACPRSSASRAASRPTWLPEGLEFPWPASPCPLSSSLSVARPGTRGNGRSRVIWTPQTAGQPSWRHGPPGGGQPWCRLTLQTLLGCGSGPDPPPWSLGNQARDVPCWPEPLPGPSKRPARWPGSQGAWDIHTDPEDSATAVQSLHLCASVSSCTWGDDGSPYPVWLPRVLVGGDGQEARKGINKGRLSDVRRRRGYGKRAEQEFRGVRRCTWWWGEGLNF